MPFTSPELVRAHLTGLRAGDLPVSEVPVVLNGTVAVQLPHAGLSAGSVAVKALRLEAPIREQKSLTPDWTGLSNKNLVPRSVLVAADNSLGTVYLENTDFIVDYAGGQIKRLVDGVIAPGQVVVIWYDYYFLYVGGDDYTIDHANGHISRTGTGAIADGQTVLVDYTVALGVVADSVIENAIAEVDDAVLTLLAPEFHNQPIPGIVIGETHWAVASVCRMQAAKTLAEAGGGSAGTHNLARVWLDLADRYDQSGRERLSRYAAARVTRRSAQRN